MREWWSKIRAVIRGREAIDSDLDAEMRVHLEMETERFLDRGMISTDARAAARARFGNSTAIAEKTRDAWTFPALEGLSKDIRQGLRTMRRSPGFALVVVLTFALGVGINTAIFSVVNTILLKPLPFPASERLVRLGEADAKASFSVTWGNFRHWRESNYTFDELAAYTGTERTLTGHGDPVVTHGLAVTAPFFHVLGLRPLMGRILNDQDDQRGAPTLVVLSHRFWSSQFGGDPGVVGSSITLNGQPYEVAGVAAPLWLPWRADYFVSMGRSADNSAPRGRHGSIRAVGRLKPGVTLASARTDLDAILRHLDEIDPGPESSHNSSGAYLAEETVGDIRGTLWLLMGAATLILLIACANVTSLLLARNTARLGELALRKAIGAGQFRLVRQLLTENIVLAGAGGVVGIGFAYAALRVLLSLAPPGIPRLSEAHVDPSVLTFAALATLLAGLLAGIAPTLLTRSINLTDALKEGARTAGAGRRRQTFRGALVIAEVAITFLLAFGSGLLIRSLLSAQSVRPGFNPDRLLSFSLSLPSARYKGDQPRQFYASLLANIRTTRGVTGASAVMCPPSAGDCGDWFFSVVGRPDPPRDQVPISLFNSAEPGYFQMMGIPLREGREFRESDLANGPKVAVINETLARQYWPKEPAVGHQIRFGGPYQESVLLEIIGVAADVRQFGLDQKESMPEIVQPNAQTKNTDLSLVVRTAGDPSKAMSDIRGAVLSLDRNLPLRDFGTLEDAFATGLGRRRFITMLLTLFAGLALVLAAIGIYGLLSYWVSSREPEIAVRLALGASPALILRWTSLHALKLALAGVGLGLAGAWFASRLLEELVFGIRAANPATMAGAALGVTLVAVSATAIPAVRAARVDVARRLKPG